MLFVPVVSSTGNPLMPCHPARARQLVRNGKALRRFNRGLFYIKLTQRADGATQPVALGIDPGSKFEGFTVQSEAHTFENLNAEAVTWVKDAIEARRNLRRSRRKRKTPYRQCRHNRGVGFRLSPSTRARWGWKLRIANWLSKLYPISCFVVEDIKAATRKCKDDYATFGQTDGLAKRHNKSFSPLEVGKTWFYQELAKLGRVETKQGFETFEMRNQMGLNKLKDKSSKGFYAHCVDSWTLSNSFVGGHTKPENTRVRRITPLRFHRRQLHVQNPTEGGVRKNYGGTRSLGFTRGSLIKHTKKGLVYVGGTSGGRISLRDVETGKRLGQRFKPEDCIFLSFNTWRTELLPTA